MLNYGSRAFICIVVVGQKLLTHDTPKMEYVIFGVFRGLSYVIFGVFRGLSHQKFRKHGKKRTPFMSHSGPSDFKSYRFHGCGLQSLGVWKRTKSKKAWRTDRQVQNYMLGSHGACTALQRHCWLVCIGAVVGWLAQPTEVLVCAERSRHDLSACDSISVQLK